MPRSASLGAAADHAGAAQEAPGLAPICDGHGPHALETLVRYRGSVLAGVFRAQAALKVLQADARATPSADRLSRATARSPRAGEVG